MVGLRLEFRQESAEIYRRPDIETRRMGGVGRLHLQ